MEPSTFVSIGLIVALPGIAETVFCLPILLSARTRALFRSLPPARSVAVSYLSIMLVLSIPFVAGIVAVFGLAAWDEPIYNVLIRIATVVSVSYLVVLPATAIVGLPRYGLDWDPTGYGVRTWTVLLLSTLWYVVPLFVPIALLSALLALPTG